MLDNALLRPYIFQFALLVFWKEEMAEEFRAVWRYARISAKKARPVIDLIRGRNVNEARVILDNTHRRASVMIKKVLESAIANAVYESQRRGIDILPDRLSIVRAYVDEGPRMKRWRPVARGRAHPYKHYNSHITIVVAERKEE